MQMDAPRESFRDFIKRMLQIAKINEEYRDSFTDEAGMQLFLRVVTHPTHDSKNNYELLEFIGDGIIKAVNSQYLVRRFPQLAAGAEGSSEGTLSKVRRALEQKKTLADIALKLGFWSYVRADEETLARNRNKTLEDVFEAFIGALVEIVDIRVKRGLGYNYAYNFIEVCLNDLEIDISKEALDDPITRLNELYKARELKGGRTPIKWGDALYVNYKYIVPKVGQLPPFAREGELVFLVVDGNDKNIKNVHVWSNGRWVPAWNAPPNVRFYQPPPPPPHVEGEELDDTITKIWYSGVLGFLNARGPVSVTKQNQQSILAAPSKYGADIIGQGIAFLLNDAKKIAAKNGLKLLEGMGISKF